MDEVPVKKMKQPRVIDLFVCLLALTLGISLGAFANVIVLRNGKRFEGTIVEETLAVIRIQIIKDGRPSYIVGFDKDQIETVQKGAQPVTPKVAPTNSEREELFIDVSDLPVGTLFRAQHEIPLMPELNPADPLAALLKVTKLELGTTCEIEQIGYRRGQADNPWYLVKATLPRRRRTMHGWVNPVALIAGTEPIWIKTANGWVDSIPMMGPVPRGLERPEPSNRGEPARPPSLDRVSRSAVKAPSPPKPESIDHLLMRTNKPEIETREPETELEAQKRAFVEELRTTTQALVDKALAEGRIKKIRGHTIWVDPVDWLEINRDWKERFLIEMARCCGVLTGHGVEDDYTWVRVRSYENDELLGEKGLFGISLHK